MENIFDSNTLEYDEWYDKHSVIYHSEIETLKKAIPVSKKRIEIGVGTGRFSTLLNITNTNSVYKTACAIG